MHMPQGRAGVSHQTQSCSKLPPAGEKSGIDAEPVPVTTVANEGGDHVLPDDTDGAARFGIMLDVKRNLN